ncbi:MAG: polymer-forming cytoskeletal protein [Pseudomonadales bacterium]|nr:polymer-forming cytoskeletal protein [Pseudomonadales bacterium]
MFGKNTGNEAGITLIASNCEMSGDIYFSDHLIVNGTVKGNIYAKNGAKALVEVSEKGKVNGDIQAPSVVVNGQVLGDIHCSKHIELASRAEIRGNVYYNLIEMVMGSRVDGSLVHVKPGAENAGYVAPEESNQTTQPNVKTASNVTSVKSKTA